MSTTTRPVKEGGMLALVSTEASEWKQLFANPQSWAAKRANRPLNLPDDFQENDRPFLITPEISRQLNILDFIASHINNFRGDTDSLDKNEYKSLTSSLAIKRWGQEMFNLKLDGKVNWKAVRNLVLIPVVAISVGMVLWSCTNGVNGNGSDNDGAVDAFCANALKLASENHVDLVLPADSDSPDFDRAAACFDPHGAGNHPDFALNDAGGDGAVLGAEWTTPEGNKIPLLAVPISEIDSDGDGSPDSIGFNLVGVQSGTWVSNEDGSVSASLLEFSIDVDLGLLIGDSEAKLIATEKDGQVFFEVRFGGVKGVPVDIADLPGGDELLAKARLALGLDRTIELSATGEAIARLGDGFIGQNELGLLDDQAKLMDVEGSGLAAQVIGLATSGEAAIAGLEAENLQVVAFEWVGTEGSAPMVFVLEYDDQGQMTGIHVGWFMDDDGIKRLPTVDDSGGININDFDKLVPSADGKNWGILSPDGKSFDAVLIIIDDNGQAFLVDPHVFVSVDGVDRSARAKIRNIDVGLDEPEPTLSPAEQAAMIDEQKLDSAPEMEGREKELHSAHVYYRDAEGNITHLFDLRTGELVRVFPVCGLQEGQNCNFEMGDLSDFAEFVQTQLTADMFDPAKINWVDEFDTLPYGAETILVPNDKTAPHYTQAGSAPFIREDFTGRVMISPTEQGFVVASPQFIPGVEPQNWPVMIGISSHEGFSKTPQVVLDTFENDMNIVAWRVDPESIVLATRFVNPATKSNFTQSEVLAIIEEMRQGDFSHTHGLVLKIMVAKTVSGIDVFK